MWTSPLPGNRCGGALWRVSPTRSTSLPLWEYRTPLIQPVGMDQGAGLIAGALTDRKG